MNKYIKHKKDLNAEKYNKWPLTEAEKIKYIGIRI